MDKPGAFTDEVINAGSWRGTVGALSYILSLQGRDSADLGPLLTKCSL